MKKQHVRLSLAALICLILLFCIYSAARLQAAPPAVPVAGQPPAGPTRLLRYADISKDKVAFSYAGDLWTASREGGAAVPRHRQRW